MQWCCSATAEYFAIEGIMKLNIDRERLAEEFVTKWLEVKVIGFEE